MPDGAPNEPLSNESLALMRTRLANERTVLAYVRTSIMLLATGATLVKFSEGSRLLVATGWVSVALGIVVIVAGAAGYARLARKLD